MRTISNLLNHKGKVYIYLNSPAISQQFRDDAEREGFTLPGNGESDIYALNHDKTMNSVGFVGHVLFHNTSQNFADGTPVIRVDYEKYISGTEDYYYKNRRNSL